MRRLRSLLVGDCSFYPSELIFGVAQGATLLGHWHSQVDIRAGIDVVAKRAHEVRPDVLWGHMLLWSPAGAAYTERLLELCADLRRRYGTRVLLHDGDARRETRWARDVSAAVDLALCNHAADRSAWRVPQVRWPYFAFAQRELGSPRDDWRCELAFAGRRSAAGLYAARTAFLGRLADRLGERMRVFPAPPDVPHTLFTTPELCASADAVLGYGRPADEAPGWTDVRVFLVPGAGGVLLHDDAETWLEPHVHFVPYRTGDVESVERALAVARESGPRIRLEAFGYVQAHHSSVDRVRQALDAAGLGRG